MSYVYVIWMWINWYRKYQPVEPEYEVWWRVSEANESQTSYSIEQADIFQYLSYLHSIFEKKIMEGGLYKYPMKNILRTAKFLTTWGLSQRYCPGL